MSFSFATASPAPMHTIIRVWDEESLLLEQKIKPAMLDTLVHPSDRFFVVGFRSGDVMIYDGHGKFRPIIHLPGLSAMALSDNGRLLALGNSLGIVEIWQVPSKQTGGIATCGVAFKGHKGQITCLAFEKNARTVLSGGTDQLLYRWDAETGKELQCCEGHSSEIVCVAVSNGPGCLTAAGIRDGSVRLWNLDFGTTLLATVPIDGVSALAVVSITGEVLIGTKTGVLRRWNLMSGNIVPAEKPLCEGAINKLVYDEKAKVVVAGCEDGSIHLIDPDDPGKILRTHQAPGSVKALDAFRNDWRYSLT